jgi:hypothetical protein
MARSGRDAGKPPAAITARGSSGSASRPAAPGRGGKVVMGLVALGLVRQVLRSRGFQEGVAVTAIALGALRGIGQENRASTMARLSAWNKRQVEFLEHQAERQVQRVERQAERQARAVKGAGRMAQSGPVSMAAGDDAVAGDGRRA